AGEQREHEAERHQPVQHARIDGMAQQLAAMYDRAPVAIARAACLIVETLDRSAHGCSFRLASVSSGRSVITGSGSGCGSFGPTAMRWKKTAKMPKAAINSPAGFASHFQTV